MSNFTRCSKLTVCRGGQELELSGAFPRDGGAGEGGQARRTVSQAVFDGILGSRPGLSRPGSADLADLGRRKGAY